MDLLKSNRERNSTLNILLSGDNDFITKIHKKPLSRRRLVLNIFSRPDVVGVHSELCDVIGDEFLQFRHISTDDGHISLARAGYNLKEPGWVHLKTSSDQSRRFKML